MHRLRICVSGTVCNKLHVDYLKPHLLIQLGGIRMRHDKLFRLLDTMPKKVEGPRETLRHVKYRAKRAEGGHKMPAPSRIDVHVVGSGARGTPRSLVISTDYSRYLFNCGEGTQRIAQEHKIKLSKLENVFITHKSWENLGGLLGMALTLESTNVPQITLHGPDGIEKVVRMAKSFNSQHSTIKLEKKALSDGRFEDTAVGIEYVVLWKEKTHHKAAVDKAQESGQELPGPAPSKRQKTETSPPAQDCVVAYVCKPHPPLRKLIIEKCVELGVPSGPLCGKLKEEQEITLDDGTVITPDQVLSKPETSKPIVVLECPSVEFLKPLLNCQVFNQLQSAGAADSPNLIVHMTPASILESAEYQAWMSRFGSETSHLIINENTSTIASEGMYRIQAMLNLIEPRIFPLLPHQTDKENLPPDCDNVIMGRTNLVYQYRPSKGFNRDLCVELDNDRCVEAAKEKVDVLEELERLDQARLTAARSGNAEDPGELSYPEVIFLGTGSSIPSKVRNVSCILVQTEQDRYMLLDCGEGTLGQLYHYYGERLGDVLENLTAVFVSHMHADHHLGMFGVLEARKQALEARGKPHTSVLLLAPIQMTRWLKFYSQQIKESHSYVRLVALQDLLPHQLDRTQTMYNSVLEETGLKDFLPVMVEHCKNAFGVCLTHESGWKLVYSGDTMPCNRLVEAGENCDLLIHEATMEDDLEDEAKYKTHSTTSQAIDVGIRMKAKFILLTHFSQRYSKIPVFNEKFSDKVGIAFDNMRVRLKDLGTLPLFTPALKAMFAEECALLEEKSLKRNLNKKRVATDPKKLMEDFLKESSS